MTEARTVEKLALIGSCFSDSEFQSLAPYYGVDENENETSDDSVLSVASLAATFRIVTSITSTMAVSAASNAKRRLRAAAT
jgi:hypothetical protein